MLNPILTEEECTLLRSLFDDADTIVCVCHTN